MLGKKNLEWADHLSADRRKRLVEPVQDHESLTHSGSQRANHKHIYIYIYVDVADSSTSVTESCKFWAKTNAILQSNYPSIKYK